MSQDLDKKLEKIRGLHMLGKEEVSTLRMLIRKEHRTPEEWQLIHEMVSSHTLLTGEPAIRTGMVSKDSHILREGNALMVFTNSDDCEAHIDRILNKENVPDQRFDLRILSYEEAINAANERHLDVRFDVQYLGNYRFLSYSHKTKKLKVSMMVIKDQPEPVPQPKETKGLKLGKLLRRK